MHTYIPPHAWKVCTSRLQILLKFLWTGYLGLGHLSSCLLPMTPELTFLSQPSIASCLMVYAFRALWKKFFPLHLGRIFVTASQVQNLYLVFSLFAVCFAMRCTGTQFSFFVHVQSDFPSTILLLPNQITCSHMHHLSWKYLFCYISWFLLTICSHSYDFFWLAPVKLVNICSGYI